MARFATAAIALGVFLLQSCEQDPTAQYGTLVEEKPEPPKATATLSPYGVTFSEIMEFREGTESEYALDAWSNEGQPSVRVENLPEGAVFDEEERIIRWQPVKGSAGSSTQMGAKWRFHVVKVSVASDAYPNMAPVERSAIMIVEDNPGALWVEIVGKNTRFVVKEGKQLHVRFKVMSDDFPQGPFFLHMTGQGSGLFEVKNGPVLTKAEGEGMYQVRWTPPCDFLGSKKKQVYSLEVSVIDPRGREGKSNAMTWEVEETGWGC